LTVKKFAECFFTLFLQYEKSMSFLIDTIFWVLTGLSKTIFLIFQNKSKSLHSLFMHHIVIMIGFSQKSILLYLFYYYLPYFTYFQLKKNSIHEFFVCNLYQRFCQQNVQSISFLYVYQYCILHPFISWNPNLIVMLI